MKNVFILNHPSGLWGRLPSLCWSSLEFVYLWVISEWNNPWMTGKSFLSFLFHGWVEFKETSNSRRYLAQQRFKIKRRQAFNTNCCYRLSINSNRIAVTSTTRGQNQRRRAKLNWTYFGKFPCFGPLVTHLCTPWVPVWRYKARNFFFFSVNLSFNGYGPL